ncbi:[FeFe] hydrogenase H-cluster radical SAM maturase HydG [Heliobacillus mobilis]|uniref:[FeFe] hydrogenase H-cluster radical SAM maturase HydG n=1 Tax=Heliobacterium mobile TaxID=28064 RepID=A0A6I3SPC6_HELMO|nr:[FeFe] hydrogenase H-cluster radical SAM maturase HydG [Heliobacterium mobile]MTV50107.1 [FeFe] hydrogenase H-cluster radical SAM maturase HydG [Heliobacterium mobile]
MSISLAPIHAALEHPLPLDQNCFDEVLAKAREKKGLSLRETALLLSISNPEWRSALFAEAGKIKDEIYGKRIVLFAPLYTSNRCINDCLYCGFRRANTALVRKSLTVEEVRRQAMQLEAMGHKRLLLVAGEHPKEAAATIIAQMVEAIYSSTDIRRLNVNCAPLSIDDFRILKDAQIGTYQLFQETYHPDTYAYLHPSGPKADYFNRLTAMDRAMEAGIDDVGLGVLFGLYDHPFEILALLEHARILEDRYGAGPHTVSVPRLKPAFESALTTVPYSIDDETFKQIVAVLRLAIPYTGLILSTRESAELRNELLHLGISQISAGSSTTPGGYRDGTEQAEDLETKGSQFYLEDHRSLPEVTLSIMEKGFIPSFCTACYRSGRTGEDFMALAKTGHIAQMCDPNALLTLQEYLLDYGDESLQKRGAAVIEQALTQLSEEKAERLRQGMERLRCGERDIYI